MLTIKIVISKIASFRNFILIVSVLLCCSPDDVLIKSEGVDSCDNLCFSCPCCWFIVCINIQGVCYNLLVKIYTYFCLLARCSFIIQLLCWFLVEIWRNFGPIILTKRTQISWKSSDTLDLFFAHQVCIQMKRMQLKCNYRLITEKKDFLQVTNLKYE